MTESSVDPFGLSNRRRRVPTSLEVYISPQSDKSKRGDEYRQVAIDTESDEMTSPVSNSKPSSPWNVSRISPQETVSILSIDEERKQRLSIDVSTTSSVAASQNMRKQLLQLVTSLQTNLNESQRVQDQQQEKILAQERELQKLQSHAKQIEFQKTDLIENYKRKDMEQNTQLQAIQKDGIESTRNLERALEQLSATEFERNKAFQMLEQMKNDNIQLRTQVEEIEAGSNNVLSARQKLEQEQLSLQEREFALAEKEIECEHHRKSLEQREAQLAYTQSRLTTQTETVTRERAQVQSLQQQLLNLQTTQMDLESTHVEEELRLADTAEQLDKRERDLRDKQIAVHMEQDEHQRIYEKKILEMEQLENKVKRTRQDILTQQAQLEGWEENLHSRQLELDTKAQKIAKEEAVLAQKVNDLARIESTLVEKDEELERRSNSYDAKLLLTQQALDELRAHRQAEEQRLEVAMNNLEETERQTRKIRFDAKTVKDALKTKMGRAHQEFERIQVKLTAKKNELEDVKSRLTLFVVEDGKSRAVAMDEAAKYQAQLKTLGSNLEQLKLEKNVIDAQINDQKVEYDTIIRRISDEKAMWKQELKQSEMKEEERNRINYRENEAKIEALVQKAKDELVKLRDEVSKQEVEVADELIRRFQQFDQMRSDLDKTTKSLFLREERIREAEGECNMQRDRLDRMLSQLDYSTENEKVRREEMSWELERLQSLTVTERHVHENDLRALTASHEFAVEKLREEHREALILVADKLDASESARSKLEIDYTKIVGSLETRHDEFASLREEKIYLTNQLATALIRLETVESEVLVLRKSRDDATNAERMAREKALALMERLEGNGSMIQMEQEAIRKQQLLLEEQKLQIQGQLDVLKNTEKEVKENVLVLRSKENEFTSRQRELVHAELEAKAKHSDLLHASRRLAIQRVLQKSWREDKEAVSAAFSKWVRVTMLHDDQQQALSFQAKESEISRIIKGLDKDREEIESIRLQLEKREMLLAENEKKVEDKYEDIGRQAKVLDQSKEKLASDFSRFEEEKVALLRDQSKRIFELNKERELLEKDRATLTQLDKFLLVKGKKLEYRERAIEVSQSSLSPDSTKHFSAALEKSLEQERRVVDEATQAIANRERDLLKREAALGTTESDLCEKERQLRIEATEYCEAHERIKRLAEQLREKEDSLKTKEAELKNSLTECRSAQTRIHLLAQQLKQKDDGLVNDQQALALRCKECDECELQLSVWQQELDGMAETLRSQENAK